jgi:magnesium chelatase family protein
MLAKVFSSAVIGIEACRIEVEVDVSQGLPMFSIVGLPEVSVRESKERVKRAIHNSGYPFPCDRITVNLAPADVKKEGTGFDLPLAVGILTATGVIPQRQVTRYLLSGELSLDGHIKRVKGTLPMALAAKNAGYEGIIVPHGNKNEAAVVSGIAVFPVQSLSEVVDFFRGFQNIEPEKTDIQSG